jgi:S1/P1 Nuclease
MKKVLALAALVAAVSPAPAWYDKGHMVVAHLAWQRLNDNQRAQVIALLKKHPHYEQFLVAKRPNGVAEDEWAFMRAATWPDWVGTRHRKDFHHGPWHFINYPFVPPGSHVDASRLQPKPERENIVWALGESIKKIEVGTDSEKAIYLCWLLHLVGDIHQPLHCVSMFSERFSQGDRGGNLVAIRVRSGPLNLHAFWDGLLGSDVTAGAIGESTREIESLLREKAGPLQRELEHHRTFESWAKESFELAKNIAYMNGNLKFVRTAGQPDGDNPPQVPADYASNAGRTARMQIGKAGLRLAAQLRDLFP